MLRITAEENGGMTRFRLEGKLKGDWVRELERCWIQARNEHPEIQFLVELSHVDYVDESGRDLLSCMVYQGAGLEARNNLMSASLVEEIVHGSTQLRK
ncbi:MAG TPA: hypothetical protein VMS18_13590 [Candidatus Binatia bacterium]|nr:hypothetical protein [Candidatus Binatia bacterium]